MSDHPFDPVAVGDQIAAYEAEASKAKGALLDCSKKSGALLFDVQQNHPEHLEAICARVGISRSRRHELLMITSGRRTHEETKKKTKDRVDRHRAKKRTQALPKPEFDCPLQADVTDNVEDSAERRKAEYTALYPDPVDEEHVEVEPIEAPQPQIAPVEPEALAEFKAAADRWLPNMSDVYVSEAIDYALAIMHRLTRERRAAA
jgi:hypothetical protein